VPVWVLVGDTESVAVGLDVLVCEDEAAPDSVEEAVAEAVALGETVRDAVLVPEVEEVPVPV
jgi:hypothetical protein